MNPPVESTDARRSEVHPYVVTSFLPLFRRRFRDVDGLFKGLSFSARSVVESNAWLDWDDFNVFLGRLADAAGGPEAWEAMCTDMVTQAPLVRVLALGVMDTRML